MNHDYKFNDENACEASPVLRIRPLRGTPQAFQTQTRTPSPTKRNAITLSKPSNVVLLGDSKCGKSTLILSYMNQRFTRAPTFFMFETYDKSINFNNDTTVDLQIWDFPGSHDFDRFRPLAYANAAGIIICFDLATPESFHNVKDRWIPEKLLEGVRADAADDK
ncbi:Rho-related GTP-binding protein RhoD [Cyberlindnera fabianii]|uniref:Rho-related GTP-binding protein RhoD n=1 Tax=Cyberlindnera fabianii TaxID=36022 RepID=A0A1V2LDK6_CYBFA|nr:Rho-related GTP-binding protein RhoD [Cyberlindnera fabianii]